MRGSGVLLVAAALVLAAGTASVSGASPETRYVSQLRRTADQVRASAKEVAALPRNDPTTLAAAGTRLQSAAAAACRTLRAYQNATTRYGTDEEYRLIRRVVDDLGRARARLGSLAGVTLEGATAKQRSAAEEALRAHARTAARKQIAKWVKDERLRDLLTDGDIRQLKQRLEQELARRIEGEARKLSLRATGIAISLDLPIKKQAQAAAEQAAVNWLAKAVFKTSPNAFVVQFVGKPIVRFLRTQLTKALRDHRHVTARTKRTVKGFDNRRAELERLIARADSAPLATVRRALARAQRALDATAYLKSDLRKQGRTELQARLRKGELLLAATMRATRAAFLLDSRLARTDLRAVADAVCKVQGEVRDVNKTLPKAKPGSKGGSCTASLRTDKGKPGVSAAFTLTLKPNPEFADKRVLPFVTATTSGTGGDQKRVPVLFKLWFHKKGSDALFVGVGDPRGLDFNQDVKAGRSTPERIEGMFVNATEKDVRANSPFKVRLFVTAFDEKGYGVWTELVGLCRVG